MEDWKVFFRGLNPTWSGLNRYGQSLALPLERPMRLTAAEDDDDDEYPSIVNG